jgi:[acyl-carrier-protein] S-malonyltransferase
MNDDTLAILFPGQGVGDPECGNLVHAERPDLHALACELAGTDPFTQIAAGTEFAQPAIYCASIASFERLGRPRATAYAGHSLGEIGALAAAGAISDADGVRIAAARGRLCRDAAEAAEPGSMLAVGGDGDAAAELAAAHGLAVANHNSPEQFVLSGPEPALDAARAAAKERGLRAKRLAVAGAFHSPAMEPAVAPFAATLDGIEFTPTEATVISGVSARPFEDDPRPQLVASLTGPVRWVAVMHRLRALGAWRFLDVGPGRVLGKLVPRILDPQDVKVEAAEAEVSRV